MPATSKPARSPARRTPRERPNPVVLPLLTRGVSALPCYQRLTWTGGVQTFQPVMAPKVTSIQGLSEPGEYVIPPDPRRPYKTGHIAATGGGAYGEQHWQEPCPSRQSVVWMNGGGFAGGGLPAPGCRIAHAAEARVLPAVGGLGGRRSFG